MLEVSGMRTTPLLPSLPVPLWPPVVAPDRVLCMGYIEEFEYLNWVDINDLRWIELLEIELFDYSTVSKQMNDV